MVLVLLSISVSAVDLANDSDVYVIEWLGQYSEGLMAAGVWDGKWTYGYINAKNEWVIKPQFDEAMPFKNGFAVVGEEKNGKMVFGHIKKDGTYLYAPKYDAAEAFHGGFAKVSLSHRWGLIDQKGKLIVETKYNSVSGFFTKPNLSKETYDLVVLSDGLGNEGFYLPNKSMQSEIIYQRVTPMEDYLAIEQNKNGQSSIGLVFLKSGKIIPPKYESIVPASQYVFDAYGVKANFKPVGIMVKEKGRWGLLDLNGDEVLSSIYDALEINEANRILATKDKQISLLNLNGTPLIQQNFDQISAFHWRSNMIIYQGGKMGLLKPDGTYLIKPTYDAIDPFSVLGFARVKLNNRYGIIDRSGKTVIETVYDAILPNDEKSVKVIQNGKETLLGLDYQPLQNGNASATDFDTIGLFENGFARVTKGDKIGYVREDMTYVVKPIYDSAYRSVYGGQEQPYFTTHMGKFYGAVTLEGLVVEPIYASPPHIAEGIALVVVNGKTRYLKVGIGYLNGESYVSGEPFNEGKALVTTDDFKRSFIDLTGKRVHGIYPIATGFSEGLAFVYSPESGGAYMNHAGEVVLGKGLNLTMGYPFKNGIAGAGYWDQKLGKMQYGTLKKDGTWLVKPQFDQIFDFGNGMYKYGLNGKMAQVTPEGKIVWE